MQFDAIILGAGAAGLMCAIEAGKRGRRVALLERSEKIGKKILISGGGRCNFTNLHCAPQNFLSAHPHFSRSALARYTPADFIALGGKHGAGGLGGGGRGGGRARGPRTQNAKARGRYCDLAGIPGEIIASTDAQRSRKKMLTPHRGRGGPAILQISSYWKPGAPIAMD